MGFAGFEFHPAVAAGIKAMGYTTPTPIQEKAISPVIRGLDVMCLAQTGTGKTAVFVLPILERLMTGPRKRVRALVVAPTRELAEQTHVFFRSIGKQTGLHSMTMYGGVGAGPQLTNLRAGCEIVVACPGRLLDHIGQGNIDLSKVEVLVLDEADRMLDMGFLPDIRRIMRHVPQKRQTLLFSATMPDEIRRLAGEMLRNPITVQVAFTAPLKTVSHALYPLPQHLKTSLLVELLRKTDTDSVLVFTRTKHRAKRLALQLGRSGFKVASLQGNLSQKKRQAALDGFRDGSYQILVATDIAARGIDVSSISHVINYDMPDTADAYTHRIGRTGRAARTGDAFTLVCGEDEEMIGTIERLLGARLERRTLDGFDYGRAAPPREARPAGRPQHGRPSGHSGHRQGGGGGFRGGSGGHGRGFRGGGGPLRHGRGPPRSGGQGGQGRAPGNRGSERGRGGRRRPQQVY
ncbi:MAG: DEAD/DEAH box helicase [Euryarchaeota archaeon]|nr:DEAD/DEAH box helicase [Euryarchaeota archaeon]